MSSLTQQPIPLHNKAVFYLIFFGLTGIGIRIPRSDLFLDQRLLNFLGVLVALALGNRTKPK